jgi:tetratricopeptide (TPR) repeat protein
MAVEVFISYAHKDRKIRDELAAHLSNLRNQGIIRNWYDGDIVPGTEWKTEIMQHLRDAHIILLLISSDFMASSFCYSIELQESIARHEAKQARVIPILLRPTDWEGAPFANLQMLPSGGKPITKWKIHDDAFQDVVDGIRRTIQDMQESPSRSTDITSIDSGPGAPAPIWYVPYRRNPFFTGQEDILTRLHTALAAYNTPALTRQQVPQAISGLSGIGKTQIALEYAYRHRHEYRAVLWVQADTREDLVLGYKVLASLLNLPEKDAKDQTITIEAVKHWLSTHDRWLLILDNTDDLTLIDNFLPAITSGLVLLTTRAQAHGTLAKGIAVEQMELEDAALLLLRRTKVLAAYDKLDQASIPDRTTALDLAHELGGLPLALDQAGAYIEETGCGVAGYAQRYRRQRTALLKRRGRLVTGHPEPVATTWSLSFAKVEQVYRAAADLLRFCAFLHPSAIPEELLTTDVADPGSYLHTLANDPVALDEAIEILSRYSFVRRNTNTQTLSIHSLVQAVLRDTMSEEHQRQWAEQAMLIIHHLFPDPQDPATWTLCERYILHVQVCASWIARWQMMFDEAVRLLNQAAVYLYNQAQYQQAESLYQCALAIREQTLGPNHPHIASTLNDLAALFSAQGEYEQAELLYQRALAIREQALGSNHLETAVSLNDLAILYSAQGKYAEAEPLYQRALAIREQGLVPNHPHTANSLNNLAYLYNIQGKYMEAEPLLQRALAIHEEMLGPNHPTTVIIQQNYAICLQKLQHEVVLG